MHEGSLWPLHIKLAPNGDLLFQRRRAEPGLERSIRFAQNMTGKSLRLKVRANGTAYEVYQKSPLGDGPWQRVIQGTGPRAEEDKISFRWGMYVGSKSGQTVPGDALLLVTDVVVR
jgi:hypothetical protein